MLLRVVEPGEQPATLLVAGDVQHDLHDGHALLDELDHPEKHWKFSPGDVTERALWPAYQEAYQIALTRTSTGHAPWYAVPADSKPHARAAVQQILIETLRDLDLQWPVADFDVAEERRQLAES